MLSPQLRKEGSAGKLLRDDPVDPLEMSKRGTLSILGPFSDVTLQLVPGPQIKFLDHPGAHVDVVFSRCVGFHLPSDKP
jgi:hypothetical protein